MTQALEGHTVHRYDGELNQLHLLLLEMGGLVEAQLELVLKALHTNESVLVARVREREKHIDQLELELDDKIATVIAKRTPVARDLRTLLAFSKIVSALEHIGDEAVRVTYVIDNLESTPEKSEQLLQGAFSMGRIVSALLHRVLVALDQLDPQAAMEVIRDCKALDDEFEANLRRTSTYVLQDARNVGLATYIVLVIRALERVGDHAKNLAEYLFFLVDGSDIRHQSLR